MNSTKLLFNLEIPKANNLKVTDNIGSSTQPFRYMKDASEMSLGEEFLNLSQRKTIEELKDCQYNIVCIVLGTIKHLIGGNDLWYVACVYNKGVVTNSKRIFSTKYEKYVWTIVPRVIDETDFVTFVVFDHDCYLLTKKTCADLIDQMDQADEPTILPMVIGELIEQTMLFKIVVNNDVNSGFEQPFRVKKLCLDQDIVAKFKNVVQNSGGVEDDLAVGVIHNDIDVIVVQDVGSKFENIDVEEKCGDNGSTSKLIEENIAESTLVKRGIYELADENDGASSRITKIIKIEKK
ncbi:unnamed protein product [Vicia faba]|uniref:Uncharacterized protein n=1 Tax=Vicia faba TaxID=3906 RepID=A0AAV1AQS6_VICFA|nr:unnamed protein product [Vicia faba]